jgi:hypothetical protein
MGVGKILKKKQRLEAGVDPWSVLKIFTTLIVARCQNFL